MKQSVLATEAEVSVTQLCHLERNAAKPSLRTLEQIATALGTTTGELLSESGERRTENAACRGGDALASDALARGWEEERDKSRETSDAFPVSRLESRATQEPESGMHFVHDPRDMALDRRVRARLAKEVKEWKMAERAAGVAGCLTLPLNYPAAAEHGALLAREVRTAGGLGPSAVVDPVAFFSGKGIRIAETDLPAEIESWSLWDEKDRNAFVFLSRDATTEKKRFRAAYEFGCVARLVSGGMRPVRDLRASRRTSRAFAAAFLLPEEAVREAAHGLAIGPENWTWELLLLVKERFGVSTDTFLYRIEELGMIPHAGARALRTKLKAHYEACRAAGAKDFEPRPTKRADGRLGALRARARAVARQATAEIQTNRQGDNPFVRDSKPQDR